MTEMQGKVLDKDRLPWMGLEPREFALERPGVCSRNASCFRLECPEFQMQTPGIRLLNAWLFGGYGSPMLLR